MRSVGCISATLGDLERLTDDAGLVPVAGPVAGFDLSQVRAELTEHEHVPEALGRDDYRDALAALREGTEAPSPAHVPDEGGQRGSSVSHRHLGDSVVRDLNVLVSGHGQSVSHCQSFHNYQPLNYCGRCEPTPPDVAAFARPSSLKEAPMAVSKRLRYEILRRDSHTCRYCGASAPSTPLRVDHVTPVALGGTDTPDNLVTSCEPCNSGKSSSTVDATLVANVSSDALRWAAALEQAAALLLEQEQPKLEYREAFLAEWNRWGTGKGEARKTVELPGDWKPSLERFRVAGLPAWAWGDIVDTSMGYDKVLEDNKFKYCCGIAWNKVTELQETARRVVGNCPPGGEKPPMAAALAALAVEVWREETAEDLSAEWEAELVADVSAAIANELSPEEVIRAVKYAAWQGERTVAGGLALAQRDDQMIEVMRWESAWQAACGQLPTEAEGAIYEAHREALRKAGASDPALATASAVAGFALSCVPHYGIAPQFLNAAGINPKQQTAEDFWALAFVATAARWPAADERLKFVAQLERLTDVGGYLIFDANAAAIAAGAVQEVDLYWNVPRRMSALLSAASPLAGGEN